MIARLVLADLVANLRVWVGLVVATATTGAVLALTGGFVESGVRAGGTTALAVYGLSGVMVVLTAATAAVVVGSVAGLGVRLQRREHALWQVVGFLPAQVTRVVLAQTLLASSLGALVGAALAVPLLGPLLDLLVLDVADGLDGLDGLRPAVGATSGVTAVVLTVLLAGLAGLRPARLAGRTSPLQLLDGSSGTASGSGTRRLVLAAALAVAALGLGTALVRTPLERVGLPLVLAGVLLATALGAAGPRVFPPLIATWTRLVPASVPSWALARATSRDDVARGAATIGPLLLGVTTPGLLFSTRAALLPPGTATVLRPETVVLLVGGPVLLAVVGSTASVFMAGRTRIREQALLRAAGAPTRTVVGSAAAEATIAVGTALVASLVVVGLALAYAAVLAGRPAAVLDGLRAWWPTLSVVLAGWALLLLATCVPAALGLRAPVTRQLAED